MSEPTVLPSSLLCKLPVARTVDAGVVTTIKE